MSEKKSYEINLDNIILRRAKESDNFAELASLVYQTDPYIYPYWFNDNIDEAITYFVPKMKEPGFIYHFENFYVAYDVELKKIVGAICAIDQTTDLNYDYTSSEQINDRYSFTIKNYVKELIKEVEEKKYMYLVNVAVDESYRSNRIGTILLRHFIEQMHEAGFDEIGFDCLMHNLRAKNLYHSLGFKEVAEGIGFDGTNHSTVEIVFFKKKLSPFTDKDFKMPKSYDVKENDLEREKQIYEALKAKYEGK